jgi:hypothetical protein
VSVSRQAKDDLLIWACWFSSDHKWLPISREMYVPPIWYKEFFSDAADLCETADLLAADAGILGSKKMEQSSLWTNPIHGAITLYL